MPSREASQYSVLYAEDNEAQRYAVVRLLRQSGFEVMEATTGEDVLRLVASRPDLVILDVKLPDMTGFEICRRIKENPRTADIPVMHLSATFITSDNRVEGLESGAEAYLTQPVEPAELIATARTLIRGRELSRRRSRTRPAVVLSIYSSAETLHTRRLVLESEGFVVLGASTPEQAVNLLQTQTVDAIIMDTEIPGLDPVLTSQMLKQVRPHIPIIQLGTNTVPVGGGDIALIKAEGAQAILKVLRRRLKRPSAAAGS